MSKIIGAEMALGPEMKSTGEVMGIDHTYPAALRKALIAAGVEVPAHDGAAFVTIADRDKEEALPIVQRLGALSYRFYATEGTARLLEQHNLPVIAVPRISQNGQAAASAGTGRDGSEIIGLIRSKTVQLVINTITGGTGKAPGGVEVQDGFRIRRAAVETGIPCLTSLDTARAVVEALSDASGYSVQPFAEYRG